MAISFPLPVKAVTIDLDGVDSPEGDLKDRGHARSNSALSAARH